MELNTELWWDERLAKLKAIENGIRRFVERPENTELLETILSLPAYVYPCRCSECPHSADEMELGFCNCYEQCECQPFHDKAIYLSDDIYGLMDAKHWLMPDDAIGIFYCAFCDLAQEYQTGN